ncbi:MAG: CDP-alcohol phosphatidyltransferase family protein [Rhodospirillaceae bacterium]
MARIAVSRPLARTSVTPSQVTAVRLSVGLSAAGCFAVGADPWWAYGAVAFIVSMVLDRGDGDLARMTGQTSAWGHKFDLWADSICNAAAFVGLGIGLRAGDNGLMAIPLGVLAGVSVTAILAMVMRAESLAGERTGELQSFYGFDADDAILSVPILILLGVQEGLLIAAAVGAPLFACGYFIWLRGKLKRVAAQQGGEEPNP